MHRFTPTRALLIIALFVSFIGILYWFFYDDQVSVEDVDVVMPGDSFSEEDRSVRQDSLQNERQGTERVRGIVRAVSACPPCASPEPGLCAPCPDDTITINVEGTNQERTIIVRNAAGMKVGYYADLLVDTATNSFIAAESTVTEQIDQSYEEISQDILDARRSAFPEVGDPGVKNQRVNDESTMLFNGNKVLKNELLVGFEVDATNDMIIAATNQVGGTIVSSISAISVFVISVDAPDEESMKEAMKVLQSQEGVEYVEPNGISEIAI